MLNFVNFPGPDIWQVLRMRYTYHSSSFIENVEIGFGVVYFSPEEKEGARLNVESPIGPT